MVIAIVLGGLACYYAWPDGSIETRAFSAIIAGGSHENAPSDTRDHDFGLVAPKSKHYHTFALCNNTQVTWKVIGTTTNCACAEVLASKHEVAPGDTTGIRVSYSAPSGDRDEIRQVVVTTDDASEPNKVLTLRAKVRLPLSPNPPSGMARSVGKGTTPAMSFVVRNYTDQKYESLSVRSSAPWVTCAVAEIGGPLERDQAQAWQLTVQFDTRGLPFGESKADLTATAPDGSLECTIPITIDVSNPVSVIPSRVFTGSLRKGQKYHYRLMIRFAEGSQPDPAANVIVTHQLGNQLNWSVSRTSSQVAFLDLDLTPNTAGFISGSIQVSWEKLPEPLAIPISGNVTE